MPRSLLGQMALVLGAALLFAQLINFALILNERQKVTLAQNQGPAIARFAAAAADLQQAAPEFRQAVLDDGSRRGARFKIGPVSNIAFSSERQVNLEARLRDALADAGVRATEARAAFITETRRSREGSAQPSQVLLVSMLLPDGSWLNGHLTTPPADPLLAARLAGATLALYLIVLGSSLLIVRRLVRPLRELTAEAQRFQGRGEPRPVQEQGPDNIRQAIEAFNTMNRRMAGFLKEKDFMLGAIGHDLRTPLASLRIRVENLEPDSERTSAIATIEHMDATLNGILYLARTGRTQEEAKPHDLASFVETIVEGYRELGRPVTFVESERISVRLRPNLLKRAVQNLIDNALIYGHSAEVAVQIRGSGALIVVRDRGPGIDEKLLATIAEPFTRAETSRNSDRGGSGLGLAIASAVAEAHDGALELSNANDGGLLATISLPWR